MASSDWAKPKVQCNVCTGSHDGTPSGLRKHEATAKHALAARMAADAGTTPVVSPLRQADAQYGDPARYAVPEADGINAPKADPTLAIAKDAVARTAKISLWVTVEADLDHFGNASVKEERVVAWDAMAAAVEALPFVQRVVKTNRPGQ